MSYRRCKDFVTGCSYLTIDELEIARALRVTISRSVLCTSFVCRVLGHSAIFIHRDEVESPILAARQIRHIDIEGKFLIEQAELLVCGVACHEIQARADVGCICPFRNESEFQGVPAGHGPVCCAVVSPFEGAVRSASLVVRT